MAKIDAIDIPTLTFQEGSAPSTPASTKWKVYTKTTGLFYMDDAGAETGPLSAGGALGAWTDYTPTWAASGGGAVLGSSTILGRYKLLDSKTGIVKINFTITTGGAFATGTGTWTFTLPSGWTTPNDGRIQALACHVNDASTTHYAAIAKISPNDTKITEIHVGDDAAPRVLDQNSPVTWATNDTIDIMGVIEIA